MPPHCTFWSPVDKEWVATFLEPELSGLSGLGLEEHIAKYELEVAYLAWIEAKTALACREGR